jgi:foldase protein PrsA
MRNVKKIVSAALIGIFMLSVTGCSLVEKTTEAVKNTVLAKVGKVEITREKLDKQMEAVIQSIKTQYGENYTKNTDAMGVYKEQAKTALDDMVTQEILFQKAEELKLVPDVNKLDEEVAKEIEGVKKNYFDNDQKKFDEGLKDYGYTLDSLKDEFKEQITQSKEGVAANRVVEYLFKDLKVEDKEISDYYEANKDSFTNKPGANLAHILVATEQEAKDIRAKIEKGEKFEDLAKQYGTDGTKDSGGSLGFYAYDSTDLVAEFMAGAKDLKEGEVSQPVKTQFGYHLIKATGIQKEAVVKTLSEVKEQIKAMLLNNKKQQVFTQKLEEWKKELKVKVYEDKI